MKADLIIQHEALDGAAGRLLTMAFNRELAERYPELALADDPNGLETSGGEFFVGYLEGEPVVCGAFRPTPDGAAEFKRMFVVLGRRGRAFARVMLDHLEGEARKAGYRHAVLETGIRQPEAQSLYVTSGWKRTTPFSSGHGEGLSVFFEKSLALTASSDPATDAWLEEASTRMDAMYRDARAATDTGDYPPPSLTRSE